MIKQIILYLPLLLLYPAESYSQEVVTGLQSDNIITKYAESKAKTKAPGTSDTLDLPFFDDFSGQSVFPDITRWLDDFVFINCTYSDQQITAGIATFDALSNSGRLYETATTTGFNADQLTSCPVNLNFPASDNIWLSFLYQPGGLGDSPEPKDSLTLQFWAAEENQWHSVWKVDGTTDQLFKQVILRIEDPRFLKKGFQFRFINYASLSPNLIDPSMVGNCDHWNIDYVLLDKNRNAGDTIYADVAFRLPLRSLLKTYEAMPWKQYREIELQEMGSSILIHYRNNDTITRNVTRDFKIVDVNKNLLVHSFTSGASNISPSTNVNYDANLVYNFNTDNNDSAVFRITSMLKTDEFDPKGNDTLVYFQIFKNFFAFDDGSAEAGYGINGLGSRNAMFAYKYVSYIPDTLRAINICFNDSYTNANKREFDLVVWDDNNGVPGNIIFTLDQVMVDQGASINGFYIYKIPEEVIIYNVFYVGWRQRSETFLNAGFDVNTPHSGRQFYWLNGEWQQSLKQGSVMIRPVIGYPLRVTSVDDIVYRNKNLIKIWPNPASDYITVDAGELMISGVHNITIMDLYGRELIKGPLTERIDISPLPAGMYVIITSLNGKPEGYSRFIKTR